jgi:hypothetical protein
MTGAIIGGVIGILIGIAFIGAGIAGKTLFVTNSDGQTGAVSGRPNWAMIIIGAVVILMGIGGIVGGSTAH